MVSWAPHCTGLISSDSFQITTLTDVSLWKFSHCGYKKWFCHFYSCPINKSDIWLEKWKNEKNPPDGADMQKNKKTNLWTLVSPLLTCPQGAQGCQKMWKDPLNLNLEVWCANMQPKLHNIWKTVRKHGFLMIFFCNFDSFLKIMQFRLHISAPNLQIRIQWILAHPLKPLGPLGAGQWWNELFLVHTATAVHCEGLLLVCSIK